MLLDDSGHQAIFWCGRGATALFVAIKAAASLRNAHTAEVILPAMSCTSPGNAVRLAGLCPRFADVDPASGLATLETIRKRYTRKTCAVVFINLYGQTAELKDLATWCAVKNIILIEDNAQSLGARLPGGEPVGSVGAVSIYSFNHKKILECGGGAMTCGDPQLWDAITAGVTDWLQAVPIQDGVVEERAEAYRNLYQLMAGLFRLRAPRASFGAYRRLSQRLLPILIEAMHTPEALAAAWPSLRQRLAGRFEKAILYDQSLADASCQVAGGWKSSGVCWRYTLFAPEGVCVSALTGRVRKRGFLASNLYMPANWLLNERDRCPVGDSLGRRVLNLCVDHTVTGESAKGCGELVRSLLSQPNQK
jgi:dTDP-4-amino-4,6-dideoxygalactose transaminase